MGAQCARTFEEMEDRRQITETPVYLHLYNLGTTCAGQAINQILRPLGTGAFHCGVEVFRNEYSYCYLTIDGQPYEGSGIFSSRPRECEGHSYSESLCLGSTLASRASVAALLEDLEEDWPTMEYDLFSRNCCHFANALSVRLGVGTLPDWVTKLSQVGSALAERQCMSAGALCCTPQRPGRRGEGGPLGKLCCCVPPAENVCFRTAPPCISPDQWKDDLILAATSARSPLGAMGEGCALRHRARPLVGSSRPRSVSASRPQSGALSPMAGKKALLDAFVGGEEADAMEMFDRGFSV